MCGRFTLSKGPAEIATRFKVDDIALKKLEPGYNIPPTSRVPVIVSTEKRRRIELAVWGLKREWAPQIANLRVEKILKGPFKTLLSSQRCLVMADGFYEWASLGKKKYPVYFRLPKGELFGFAAIYDEGEPKTFSIFTTTPHPVVAKIHDRSPVILTRESEDAWLDPTQTDRDKIATLLRPYPGALESWPVSPAVNYPKNNSPELLKPIAAP